MVGALSGAGSLCSWVLLISIMLLGSCVPLRVEGSCGRDVSAWMCLERCNSTTPAQVQSRLDHLRVHGVGIVRSISYERYNLGPNGTLITNVGLTDVTRALQQMHFRTHPMISSYPYPPQFLTWMRQVFSRPQAFIDRLASEANKHGYSGYNFDWEPTSRGTNNDAVAYAYFLDEVARRLPHLEISVDVGRWNPVWNYTLLGGSGVRSVLDMSTYTSDESTWRNDLDRAVKQVPMEKLGVGLESINAKTKRPYSTEVLEARFSMMSRLGVCKVAIWDVPLAPNFWDILDKWVSAP